MTQEEKWAVEYLYRQNFTATEIADEIGLYESDVINVLKDYEQKRRNN